MLSFRPGVGVSFLFAFVFLVPLFRFGIFFFGHDTGFYRRYLLQAVASFPNTAVPGLDHTVFVPRIVLDAARFFVSDPNFALIGTYLFFLAFGLGAFWYFGKRCVDEKAAYLSLALLAFSGVQFTSYSAFFFKSVVAFPFLILTLLFFDRGKYAWAIGTGLIVVLSHQTSSVVLLAFLVVAGIYKIIREKGIDLWYFLSSAVIAGGYLFLHPHVEKKIASPPVGIFISETTYILWSLPLFVLAGIGIRRLWPAIVSRPFLAAPLSVALAFVVFHLPFYPRIYPFLDLFLTIPGAVGLISLWDYFQRYPKNLRIALFGIVIILVALPMLFLEATRAPLLDADVQESLQELSVLPASASVITPPALLPWVQGWSLTRAYAPGNLKEPHSYDEWTRYWSHSDPRFEEEFLASFPRPLYLFIRPADAEYRPACATPVNPHLLSLETCF